MTEDEQARQQQAEWCYRALPALRRMPNGPLIVDLVIHAVNETLEHSHSHIERAVPLLDTDEMRVFSAMVVKGCQMMFNEMVATLIEAVEREDEDRERVKRIIAAIGKKTEQRP